MSSPFPEYLFTEIYLSKGVDIPVFSRKLLGRDSGLLLLVAICAVGLLFCSEKVSAAMSVSVDLCIRVLLPSLFPFFVLSALLTSSGAVQRTAARLEGFTRVVFALPGSCAAAVLLGAVGGYPVGAKTVAALYKQGLCTKEDALHALLFCNNAGPAFLIGAIGSGLLGNKSLGLFLYGLHLLSALLIGIFFSLKKRNVKPCGITAFSEKNPSLTASFLSAVTGSFSTFLNVCAFVLLFSVILCLFGQFPLFANLNPFIKGILYGMLELTSGTAVLVSAAVPKRLLLAALSFLCGWGGLSVQLQTICFLREAELPCRKYLRSKLLHGAVAALFAFLICQ